MTRPSLLGRLMRERREACGLSLRQLARRAKRSPSHVSDLELGRRVPSEVTLRCIMDTLDVRAVCERDVWAAAAGVLPGELAESLLAHPERWGDVRALLKGGDRG